MSEKNVLNKIQSHLNLLLFLSITLSILINFLPWITVFGQTGNDNGVFFSYEMMRKNNNIGVMDISRIITNIMFITWATIILGFICFIGLILYISKKTQMLSFLMIGSGSLIVILDILIIYLLSFRFIQNVAADDKISLAYIIGPFSYSFIVFVFTLLSFLVSFVVTIDIASFFSLCYKNVKSKKKKEKMPFEYSVSHTPLVTDNKTFSSSTIRDIKDEPEEWFKDRKKEEKIKAEKEKRESKEKTENKTEKTKVEKENGLKQDENSADLKLGKGERKTEKEKTILVKEEAKKTEDKSKAGFHQEFEQVLLSAIEKKKKEKKILKQPIEKYDKNVVGKIKKFRVKCLKCENVFVAEIRDGEKKIKCPVCGKEGEL